MDYWMEGRKIEKIEKITSININDKFVFLCSIVENAYYLRSSWYVLLDVIESGGRDKTSEGTASHRAVQKLLRNTPARPGSSSSTLPARYTSWEKHVECDWLFQLFSSFSTVLAIYISARLRARIYISLQQRNRWFINRNYNR